MYEYKCRIDRVVDGDTVDVDIDLGFDVWIVKQRIRLIGIDAPETRTRDLEEKEQGIKSKEYVEKHLPVGSIATLVSREYNGEKGKFGRIIGDFRTYDSVWDAERMLTELMIRDGFAEKAEY